MAVKVYEILYKKSVDKDLRKLPAQARKKIVVKIQKLTTKPRPQGVVKLSGSTNLYRIRHSEYRIIYQIKDNRLIVLVIKVGHRREVYKT